MRTNINKGRASTTLTIRLPVEDFDFLRELAGQKRMNVNAYIRAHMLDFLSKEAVKDWAKTELPELVRRSSPAANGSVPAELMEAMFASYHMLYDIVEARDPRATSLAIERAKRDTAQVLKAPQ
ncbi:MAG: hypothetical protein ACRDAM_09120, partial [Casimicrobium sp.]